VTIAVCTCALIGGGGVSTALALEQDVDLTGAGMAELGDPEDTVTPTPGAATTSAKPAELTTGPAEAASPEPTFTEQQLAALTKPQLRGLIGRTRERWLRLQAELGALETARDAAEGEVDATLAAYGKRLLTLFDANDLTELQPLREVRSEVDPTTRAALLAKLRAEDVALVKRYDAAAAAADAAGSAADAKRLEAAVAAIDLAFARDFQDGRLAGTDTGADEPAVQAKHVFATGPIPSIGYFGAASGGGMLSGWTGVAGAALGGIGCNSPDATLAATGVKEDGIASWYGPGFHGENTANGETYDQEAMTAAHKSLPFGTIVRVYSNTTARCVFVRINDRGPYIDGRIIDLSHAASTALGMDGTASVQIEVWAAPGTAVAPITEPDPATWPAEAQPAGL
jgi:rare lipoprotein A